jgi:hypothetical protein
LDGEENENDESPVAAFCFLPDWNGQSGHLFWDKDGRTYDRLVDSGGFAAGGGEFGR